MPNDVLFLGAGFSAQFGMPVMGNFFDHPTTTTALTADELDWLAGLQRGAREVVSMLSGPYDNLEHVLSIALMDYARIKTAKPEESSTYERVARLLFKVYRRCESAKFEEAARALKWLFTFTADKHAEIELGPELTVITTNYDVCVEYALSRLGVPPQLPIKWQGLRSETPAQVSGSLYRTTGSGPTLCKLHGSVNWIAPFHGDGPIPVEDRLVVARTLRDMKTFPIPMISTTDLPTYKNDVTPLLVPPMYFKHQVDPRLDANWEAAALALSRAHRVAFVGYSFPKSDSHMRYFLGTALTRNVKLKKIFIVDPRAKETQTSLNSPEFGPHFREALAPQPYPWYPEGGYRLV